VAAAANAFENGDRWLLDVHARKPGHAGTDELEPSIFQVASFAVLPARNRANAGPRRHCKLATVGANLA
jgi:hypothetical protein